MTELPWFEAIFVASVWATAIVLVVIDIIADRNSEPDKKPWHYDGES